MRKAILPLLIIMTMVLSATVATATSFNGAGIVSAANGWTDIQGNWYDAIPGTWTDGTAFASHPVATQASGEFDYWVQFKIVDSDNVVKAGLVAGGHEYAVEYKNGQFWFDGVSMGVNTNGLTNNYLAEIQSDDGNVWTGRVYGGSLFERAVTVNAIPTAATIGLEDHAGEDSPVIYDVNFDSAGAPAVIVPAAPAADNGAYYDVAQVQNFYDNIYPYLGSPYDTVTYNADGSYTIIKGYPTSATHEVAGTVISAADGSQIAGASVVVGNTLQKTDDLGKFMFDGIPTGLTDITVSANGFAGQTKSINVNADQHLNFALDKAAAGGSTIASAANDSANVTATTNVTMPTNATIAPTMAPTTAPSATQTKSPGFEGIFAAIAMIGVAGALVYLNKKH